MPSATPRKTADSGTTSSSSAITRASISNAATPSCRATSMSCRSAKARRFLTGGVGRWVLGGWQLNGVLSLMTGRPLTFGTNVSANTPGSTLTPDMVGDGQHHPCSRRHRRYRHVVRHDRLRPGGDGVVLPPAAAGCGRQDAALRQLGPQQLLGPRSRQRRFLDLPQVQLHREDQSGVPRRVHQCHQLAGIREPEHSRSATPTSARLTGTLAGLISNQGVGGTGPRAINLGLKLTF